VIEGAVCESEGTGVTLAVDTVLELQLGVRVSVVEDAISDGVCFGETRAEEALLNLEVGGGVRLVEGTFRVGESGGLAGAEDALLDLRYRLRVRLVEEPFSHRRGRRATEAQRALGHHGLGLGARLNEGAEGDGSGVRSEEHTSELQSRENLVCRHLHEKRS